MVNVKTALFVPPVTRFAVSALASVSVGAFEHERVERGGLCGRDRQLDARAGRHVGGQGVARQVGCRDGKTAALRYHVERVGFAFVRILREYGQQARVRHGVFRGQGDFGARVVAVCGNEGAVPVERGVAVPVEHAGGVHRLGVRVHDHVRFGAERVHAVCGKIVSKRSIRALVAIRLHDGSERGKIFRHGVCPVGG